MLRRLYLFFQSAVLIATVSLAHAQDANVGKVVFVSGEVELSAASGNRPVQVGDTIQQGHELITKAGGYVYVKTADNGFISLRPNSAVVFEVFQYSPDKPQESQFKTSLKYGVMRNVSGVGAQSARDKYRLNTPVAAIGIRGTDFTVYATPDVTRAAVTSGGIVMSGFNAACTPGGSGPCSGDQIAELFAQQQAGMLLQLRRGDSRPALLDRQSSHLQPDSVAPPLPNEKTEKSAKALPLGPSVVTTIAGEQAIIVRQGSGLQEKLNGVVLPSQPTMPNLPPVTVVEPVLPEQQINWGRFTRLIGESPTAELPLEALMKTGNKELVFLNASGVGIGLVRDQRTNMVLPSSGVYSFALQNHESYIVNQWNETATRAEIENASLNIDFNQQRFRTQFQVKTNAHQVNVQSVGSITGDGKMMSDQIGSTAAIQGALAKGGEQAGLLYNQTINEREQAIGATYWKR